VETNGVLLDALGDATRRSIFESLKSGPRSVGELAEGLPVSRPAVSQHLRVLKAAGLVSDRKDGTRRVYRIEPDGVARVRDYFDGFWSEALERFRETARKETR
jgi:DNA-binding transcriptional ArsR family regulator